MTTLTGMKATDAVVAANLSDRDLLNYCISTPNSDICRDDIFWRNRLFNKYGRVEKSPNKTWKKFYLQIINYQKDTNAKAILVAAEKGEIDLVMFFAQQLLKNWDTVLQLLADKPNRLGLFQEKARMALNGALDSAAKAGHQNIVEYLIGVGADNLNSALIYAASGGHKALIKYLIGKGADNMNQGLVGAAWGGHKNLILYFIYMGANDWRSGLLGAARGGHRDLVEYFVQRGKKESLETGQPYPFNWEEALQSAASGGHLELVKYFLEKTDNKWVSAIQGLPAAIKEGHREVIDYLIRVILGWQNMFQQLPPNFWDVVMANAAWGGQKDFVDYSIKKGANDWNQGMAGAALGGHRDLVDYFIEQGANDWDAALAETTDPKLAEFFIQKLDQ